MNLRNAGTFTALLVTATLVSVSFAVAQSCEGLWVERNAIYKEAGYCFKTRRAIAHFGNAGCSYDNEGSLPLSARERARVARIIAEERALGCR